jgi:hypothetical protein
MFAIVSNAANILDIALPQPTFQNRRLTSVAIAISLGIFLLKKFGVGSAEYVVLPYFGNRYIAIG